jgi:hypothetical protein
VHADHLSAAPYLQQKTAAKTGIGAGITQVQAVFGKTFNAGTEFVRDGSKFDQLFEYQDEIRIGQLIGHALHTPGHTPACLTYYFQTMLLWVIHYLYQIMARRVVISLGVTLVHYINRYRSFLSYPRRRVYICAMTTRHPVELNTLFKQPSPKRKPITFTLNRVSAKVNL